MNIQPSRIIIITKIRSRYPRCNNFVDYNRHKYCIFRSPANVIVVILFFFFCKGFNNLIVSQLQFINK